MDSEILKVVIPALIALAGTVLTLLIGIRRQKAQSKDDNSKQYHDERKEAYKLLWEKLEEVHILMRTDEAAMQKYNKAVAQVNAYIMQKAFLLDDEDQKLSSQYMDYLKQLTEIVQKYADDVPQLKYGWEITAAINTEAIKDFQIEEQAIVDKTNELREQILKKSKSIVSS